MKLTRGAKRALAALVVVGGFIATTAESCSSSSSQSTAQSVTEQYSQHSQDKVPYPLNEMDAGGWTERTLLKEHLLRQNDPNALHYVYWVIPQTGALVAQWTIKGMVFSPNSQLTNTQSITWSSNGGSGVVDAPGDNGTWGPEPFCYDFFTTSGNEVRLPCNGLSAVESDTPMTFATQPLITYNANEKSPIDKGGLKGIGGH